jgi:hypothetical protein
MKITRFVFLFVLAAILSLKFGLCFAEDTQTPAPTEPAVVSQEDEKPMSAEVYDDTGQDDQMTGEEMSSDDLKVSLPEEEPSHVEKETPKPL